MRKEYVNYMAGMPITMSLINIKQYPIHWHDSIEIIFVLKGRVSVSIEAGKYEVEDGEIEIINCDEAHSINTIDDDNEILLIHIDPNFFEKYFSSIRDIFFYTNSSDVGAQEDEKYYILRRLLSILTCEIIQKQDDYEDQIEETLVELLYHLLNNFHQLIYEKEDLKENEEQFERYDRIVRYIYNNYKNKISLSDIAKKEFLSSNYLSHEIKNTVGYSFKDFLNLTRVEESIKLLLDTDMTISEITEELGFSHSRYFNKHFKRHYKCTPLQYRKKYKVDEETLEKLKVFNELDLNKVFEYLSEYLEDYDRYNYTDKIVKVSIDAALSGIDLFNESKKIISLGEASELLKETQRSYLRQLQSDIEFDYIILNKLFSKEIGVLIDQDSFTNWYDIKELINYLLSINLRPIIVLDDIDTDTLVNLLESFIRYFKEEYGIYELNKWMFSTDRIVKSEKKEQIDSMIHDHFELFEYNMGEVQKDFIYDTCYMVPYIVHNEINDNCLCFKAFDSISENSNMQNEVFIGDNSLITRMGIRKPAYYAYLLLSKLGNELIEKGDGYIITKQKDDIQILLYSYGDDIDKIISFDSIFKRRGVKNTAARKFSINIMNLYDDYEMIKYEINEKRGSAYDYWKGLGKPARLSDENIKLLIKASSPLIDFGYAKKSNVFNILTKVQGYGAVLIELKKVQKHLF
ncbi:helix-turn-helix domain-containing protein [Brassicibacter mesophilus]|uniref:helix-turn-helix domain-containing protein n=1 Tax=Brassicibacter mesophilus TaxID=745119 RepID=UPI003D22F5C6